MDTNTSDMQSKYQKIASEYSKTRAQVTVLKKAILDEQSKVNELKETIKDRDLTIRKYEQEMDSFNFRNQQLAKRVTILQDELEGKVDVKSDVNNSIFNEELESKIEENIRLHQLLFESEEKQGKIIRDLTLRLESFNEETKCHESALRSVNDEYKRVVDKLQGDKIQLEIKCQSQERELKELYAKSEEWKEKFEENGNDLNKKLRLARRVIEDHVGFNDSENDYFNALNIPSFDRKHQTEITDLITQTSLLIRDLVTSLSNFHTYSEQRLLLLNQPSNPIHAKLAKHLHQNAYYLRPIQHSFAAFQTDLRDHQFLKLENAVGLRQFADEFDRYCAYLNKLLPYFLLSIEDECSWSSCTPSLEAKNMQFHGSLSRITAVFDKINTYVLALASQSDESCGQLQSSQQQLLSMLVMSLSDLHCVIKEASVHYNARVSIEHQLPTSTHKLRSTDECVLSSMISLVTVTGKLSSLMKSKHSLITKGLGCDENKRNLNRKISPAVSRFKKRALEYMNDIEREQPKTVAYHEALCNQQILLSSTESRESLARQLATSQDKMSKLEQSKEHWMLEFQLLQIKHEKDMKKLQKLEEQLRGAGDAISNISSGSSTDEHLTGSPTTISILGKLESQNPIQGDRESEIKNYFTQHIKELVSQMQLADSKSIAYHSELVNLHRRLQLADDKKSQLIDQLSTSNLISQQLKEEMSLSSRSYESQLNLMSEHLANMNDKLTMQKDEIDALKLKLNSTGAKKHKGK